MQNDEFFGFAGNVQKSSNALHRTFLLALERIEKEINSCFTTSTPNLTPKETTIQQRRSMSVPFSKYFEQSAASLQSTDNDSGFVSNLTHESNESLNIDKTLPSQPANSSVYAISEDALLEKPASVKKILQNENVYEEFSHLYYLHSVVPSSVQSPEEPHSGEVSSSDTSIILPLQSPIRITLNEDAVQILNKENINPNSSLVVPPFIIKTATAQTPKRSIDNTVDPNASPELFSDGSEAPTPQKLVESATKSDLSELTIDNNLVKKINKALSGILPPPSLTILQITAEEMLDKIKANAELLDLCNFRSNKSNKTLLNTDLINTQIAPWPEILQLRYHGLHYNCSNVNADIETLSVKYGQRFVGAETQSSCTVFDATASLSSPAKRRLAACRAGAGGARWSVKSPGRRLSHLARRRITFSSNSLKRDGAASVAVVPTSGGVNRQIMVDAKRFELLVRKKASPRKKTPRKSPRKRIRTPSSSTKKLDFKIRRLNNADDIASFSGGLKATKRALFQSPDKAERVVKVKPSTSTNNNASLSPWKRRPTPKQALFVSPDQHSNSSTSSSVFSTASDSRLLASSTRRNLFTSPTLKSFAQARKQRLDSESSSSCFSTLSCNLFTSPPKKTFAEARNSEREFGSLFGSLDTPSFDEGVKEKLLARVKSDLTLGATSSGTPLSLHHKKKLQWAVYEALRSQQVGLSHPNFKQYAATLARVTRRFLPNLSSNAPRPEGGTSERMLRIARQHVFAVTKGKTVEEILQSKGVSLL